MQAHSHALVLVAPPGKLGPGDLAAVADHVKAGGAATASDWTVLSEGEAAELLCTPRPDTLKRAAEALTDRPVDIALVPLPNRRKRLLIADMDSTMIGQECIDELADFAGLKAEVAVITERAMRGELDFEAALRERVAMLSGLPAETIARTYEERITFTPGGRTLVATMRASGGYAALVSGGFTAFTERVAAALGFDEHRANTLIVEDGQLAGTVAQPILGREAKLARLEAICAERNIALEDALAVGDGANDLAMIGAAGLGVAFRAKPATAAAADAAITHGDLTALLFLQGYRRDEFAG